MTLYHVAKASSIPSILCHGLIPAEVRMGRGAACEAWAVRWARRLGEPVDLVRADMKWQARFDINRICAFLDLEIARWWAAMEPGMAIIAINGPIEADFVSDAFRSDDELGAMALDKGRIVPSSALSTVD